VEGRIDVEMGTLSKALGAMGGFIAGSSALTKYLKARATTFVYSSSLPPEQACGLVAALRIVRRSPELRAALWRNVDRLKGGLKGMGFDVLDSTTHIIPILIGAEEKCVRGSRFLFSRGIITSASRFPSVPRGKSRIRVTAMATHTDAQIDWALEIFEAMGRDIGLI
jgi:7-keto-8-aminopelargonate synthetase-like enzyme